MMEMFLKNYKAMGKTLICALFLSAFYYFLYGYQYFDLNTYHYDEGIVAYGAVRILDGYIPYKDFWTLYAPAEFYVLAGVFKIFGISIIVTRIFSTIVLALTVCGIYLLVRRLCSRTIGILAFFFSLAWLRYYMVFNRPGQMAILFFIACAISLSEFLKSGKNKWLIIAGVLSGAIGLFRQDFGFYIFISLALVVLLRTVNHSKKQALSGRSTRILKKQLFLLLGLITAILPLAIYLFLESAGRDFIEDAILFPVTIYPKVRRLPLPALHFETLVFYLPVSVFLLTCFRLLFYDWKEKAEKSLPWVMLFLLFSGVGLFNYSNTRVCISHLLPTMIPAIVLLSLLLDNFLKTFKGGAESLIKISVLRASFLVCFALLFYSIKPTFIKMHDLSKIELQRRLLDVGRARGIYDGSELAQSQAQAVKYIQDKVLPNEKIFVGNLRHDKLVNSDAMFYFLSGRHSATKYYELHPGLTNTQKIQKMIIEDLVKNKVRYIVLWADSRSQLLGEPNESSKSSGVVDLDNFIKRMYQVEKKFGSYLILSHAGEIS